MDQKNYPQYDAKTTEFIVKNEENKEIVCKRTPFKLKFEISDKYCIGRPSNEVFELMTSFEKDLFKTIHTIQLKLI